MEHPCQHRLARMNRRVGALIGLVVMLSAVLAQRTFFSRTELGEPLAWTECPVRGEALVTITEGVAPADTLPVRMHEEVHAAQCRSLGPWRYRARNLTREGRLSLEAPGYCAGAHARPTQGEDTARVRERLLDDAQGAFPGLPWRTR